VNEHRRHSKKRNRRLALADFHGPVHGRIGVWGVPGGFSGGIASGVTIGYGHDAAG
jgi:hypothetical protein